MSQASATKLIPKLRFKVNPRRKLKNPEGCKGRHDKIRKTITALFRHERIELNYNRADESRGYAERLIADAIKYGDCHKPTMEMASYWIVDKPIIHKLFKVLAPRYQNSTVSYTKIWKAPSAGPQNVVSKCVLELRDNIYPPLEPDKSHNKNLIHNVLLEAAKNAYHQEKALKAGAIKVSEPNTESVIEENLQSSESEKMNSVDEESHLSNDEALKTESEHKETVKTDSSLEKELNLEKLNITEEKTTESPSESEKK